MRSPGPVTLTGFVFDGIHVREDTWVWDRRRRFSGSGTAGIILDASNNRVVPEA
jgi:hypothetical protein